MLCVWTNDRWNHFFGVFIPLRSYLGGFHMNSYWACFICSSTVLVGILLLVRFCNPNPIVSWIMLIFSVVIIVWKAKKQVKWMRKVNTIILEYVLL